MEMLKFRPLREDEIEVKVKQVKENGLVALLYKTARTDMEILDETVGAANWACDYEEIKGNLFCSISICFYETDGEARWVHKKDCGIESREDGEGNEKKGEASDAFKRAGFKWGIGRELYTAPFIWIPADKANITQNKKCYDRFSVEAIKHSEDGKRIVAIAIRNDTTGKRCYIWQEVKK